MDGGDAVMKGREGEDRRGRGDAHAPGDREPTEIAPLEIDHHRELGALLRVGVERPRERGVVVGVAPARPRSLDRIGPNGARARRAEEQLRRRRDHRRLTFEIDVTPVACVGRSQEPRKERIRGAIHAEDEPPREVDLVEVPRRNPREGLANLLFVKRGRLLARERDRRSSFVDFAGRCPRELAHPPVVLPDREDAPRAVVDRERGGVTVPHRPLVVRGLPRLCPAPPRPLESARRLVRNEADPPRDVPEFPSPPVRPREPDPPRGCEGRRALDRRGEDVGPPRTSIRRLRGGREHREPAQRREASAQDGRVRRRIDTQAADPCHFF